MTDETTRGALLMEAKQLIDGDRNNTYGPPTQDFARTAEHWTTQWGHKLKEGEVFEAHDVALGIILLKMSRLAWSPDKRDSWVDIAGYAGCGWECIDDAIGKEYGEE